MTGMVIVGGGHAAGQAAASLRQAGYEGAIRIFGDEHYLPYQRPPLSKAYLSGDADLDLVLLRPARFYEERQIDVRTGVRVTRLDPADRTLEAGGATYGWDKLLIATGGRPRRLPVEGAELPGVHYLRTLADVAGIAAELDAARRLVIVGGGYVGLEVAAVARSRGLEVCVLEMEERILQRVASPVMSEFFQRFHSARGVEIRTSARVTALAGDGRVREVRCGTETLPADLVVVGIGILPNVELAQDAGLTCENGIWVDDHCRTSAPDIYAAGDCTNHPNPLLGRRLRLESVPNAMEQARVAAANMCGGDKVYAQVPWFWSDQYDLKLQMVGFATDGDTQIVRGDMTANQFAVFYLKAGCLVGVDAVNCPREFMLARQMYGKPLDPARLADPSVELKSLA